MTRVLALTLLACALVAGAPAATASPEANGGGLILFWSESPWPSLWSVRPDGTHRRRILRTREAAKRPRLSPDRKWVAFDGARPGTRAIGEFDIQVVRLDGTGRRTLTRTKEWDVDAQWSPDGARLSFSRMPPGADWLHSSVWTVRPDGADPRLLGRGQAARWSPDGARLVLDAPTTGSDGDLFVVAADGGDRRRLTTTPALEQAAGWSPDGKRILFTRFRLGGGADVYVMEADGTGTRRLTRAPAGEIAAAWSPDGSKILFTRGDPGRAQLIVMDADGSHQRSISRNRFSGSEPSWR
jgi:Tol biopolymer transport system component